MDQSAPLMLATIRQVLYRRHVNGIRLLTVLLAIIRDGKSRTIDNDIRTDMVEQGLHRRIVVDVQPDGSMVPSRTDIRMKGTAEYFAGPVLRKVIQDSSPDKPISTYNQYLFLKTYRSEHPTHGGSSPNACFLFYHFLHSYLHTRQEKDCIPLPASSGADYKRVGGW